MVQNSRAFTLTNAIPKEMSVRTSFALALFILIIFPFFSLIQEYTRLLKWFIRLYREHSASEECLLSLSAIYSLGRTVVRREPPKSTQKPPLACVCVGVRMWFNIIGGRWFLIYGIHSHTRVCVAACVSRFIAITDICRAHYLSLLFLSISFAYTAPSKNLA